MNDSPFSFSNPLLSFWLARVTDASSIQRHRLIGPVAGSLKVSPEGSSLLHAYKREPWAAEQPPPSLATSIHPQWEPDCETDAEGPVS